MNTALDIPEIRTSIGRYLDHRALISCAQVCRAWQISFEPFIWSDLLINSDEGWTFPNLKGLARNAHLVTHLTLAGCCPLDYLCLDPSGAPEVKDGDSNSSDNRSDHKRNDTTDQDSDQEQQEQRVPRATEDDATMQTIQPRTDNKGSNSENMTFPHNGRQKQHQERDGAPPPRFFNNLQSLVVTNSRNDIPPPGYWQAIAQLLSQNKHLAMLRLSSLHPVVPPLLWRAICNLLTPLQTLHLYRLEIPPEHADLLWQACGQATIVRFVHTTLPPPPLPVPPPPQHMTLAEGHAHGDPEQDQQQEQQPLREQSSWPTFPRLQRLFLIEERGLTSIQLLTFLSQCPNLCALLWNTRVGDQFPTDPFIDRLEALPTLWPKLSQLRIPHEPFTENQLVRILTATSQLESFSALYHHNSRLYHPQHQLHLWKDLQEQLYVSLSHPHSHLPTSPNPPLHSQNPTHNHSRQEHPFNSSPNNSENNFQIIRPLQALERHFHTLRDLTFSVLGCDKTSSIVIQTVLSSCPNLVSISGEVIRGLEIALGKPWVCLNLQKFYLDIDVSPQSQSQSQSLSQNRYQQQQQHLYREQYQSQSMATAPGSSSLPTRDTTSMPDSTIPMKNQQQQHTVPQSSVPSVYTLPPSTYSRTELQKRVLCQLARLQSLKSLTLMSHHCLPPHFSPASKSHRRGLELDLRHGLDILAPLTQLHNLHFSTTQNMDLDDAYWIAHHWKHLAGFTNRLHPDPMVNQGLWEVCLRRRKDF
ncbi:hypothetical protein BGZ94_009655, partial [Podila epigama]